MRFFCQAKETAAAFDVIRDEVRLGMNKTMLVPTGYIAAPI
jgi:hypothetical protein